MNFLNIEYFLAIVEEGSFSSAARKLFISQQSLSEHVKKLEDEIGAPLFTRVQPLTLTIAGKYFAEGGREILIARDKMLRDITNVTNERRRKITVGIPAFEVPPFLPGLLSKFSADFPEYETSVEKRQVADISYNMLGIDLFVSFTPLDENLEHEFLIDNDNYVIVANRLLLTNTYKENWPNIERQLIETEDFTLLKDLPIIVLHDRWGKRARYLDMIFECLNFLPVVGFESDNGDLNASMCIRGTAAFLGSAENCRRRFQPYLRNGDNSLNMYNIKTPGVKSVIALSYEKGKKLHRAELDFIETARKFITENNS